MSLCYRNQNLENQNHIRMYRYTEITSISSRILQQTPIEMHAKASLRKLLNPWDVLKRCEPQTHHLDTEVSSLTSGGAFIIRWLFLQTDLLNVSKTMHHVVLARWGYDLLRHSGFVDPQRPLWLVETRTRVR